MDSTPVKKLAPLAELKSRAFHDAQTRLGGLEIHDDDASVIFSNRLLQTVPLVLLSLLRIEPALLFTAPARPKKPRSIAAYFREKSRG